jgi:outer membrane protein assembly factor BamB
VGNELAYFGSSADHAVRALELATGRERWSFFTEGPVRFAPAIHGKKIYVASDDGTVYCLDGLTGKLYWKFRPDIPREVEPTSRGKVISIPQVGGLHHRYARAA